MPVLIAFTALLGLAVGSFLNVVIYRVPRGESLVKPSSHCPACGRPIRNRHNIPLFGWFILRGRCADCHAPISVRYPLVELVTAVLFIAVTARMSTLDLLPALPAYLYLVAIGIALALIDIDHHRLPNVIVLPAYPVVLALLTIAAAWQHDWSALLRAVESGAILYAFYFVLAFAYPAGMGFGDVKLAGILGGLLGYLSWSALLIGGFAGFLLGAVAGVAVMASGRGNRKTALPFGPFMIAGTLLAIFAAEPLWSFYLDLLGRT
jgi:leader peptidase (prepilin peptidase)/N-methyltransferase